MKGFLKQLLSFAAILALVLLGRYYYYVAFEANIYSEVGTAIHGVMPEPIKKWGCGKLYQRFNQYAPECY